MSSDSADLIDLARTVMLAFQGHKVCKLHCNTASLTKTIHPWGGLLIVETHPDPNRVL